MNPRADKNKKRGKEKREPGSWEMDASSTAYHAAPQPSCRGACEQTQLHPRAEAAWLVGHPVASPVAIVILTGGRA